MTGISRVRRKFRDTEDFRIVAAVISLLTSGEAVGCIDLLETKQLCVCAPIIRFAAYTFHVRLLSLYQNTHTIYIPW